MMDDHVKPVVEAIHDSGAVVALVVTGGGIQSLGWVLGVAGASRTVLEAVVPYGSRAMTQYLGWQPEEAASAGTAVSLAATAYARAQRLNHTSRRAVGLSCTASIATDRPKKGAHRCHIGVWDGESAMVYSLEMEKWLREREGEDTVVSQLILRALADVCDLDIVVPVDLYEDETVAVTRWSVGAPLERLLEGVDDTLTYYGADAFVPNEPIRGAIMSGSFNPLHDGHLILARAAEKRLNLPLLFEISVHNVDKPSLTIEEIAGRLAQFGESRRRVVLTREPLYEGKVALLPGCTFVMGYDTVRRLVDPAYYADDRDKMLSSLETVRQNGGRILVAGRLIDDSFKTVDDLPIPAEFADIFNGLSEDEFRVDISSTEIRQKSWWDAR